MRIFIPSGCADPDAAKAVITDPGDVHHIRGVMRMGRGEKITLCGPEGLEYECVITSARQTAVELEILSSAPSRSEPRVYVSVYAAMMKGDKMDELVMKCIELGASAITPFISSRCVSRPDAGQAEKKRDRLNRIARGAAQQSMRGRLPQVGTTLSFEAAVGRALESDLAVFLYENERETGLSDVLADTQPNTVSIMSGPEGGFSPDEAAYAVSKGMKPATLGRRILRCETAPLCALAAVMYQYGEF